MTGIPVVRLAGWLDALDQEKGYAVAKAPDLWANLERGGDWDLVVSDRSRAESLLRRIVGEPNRVIRHSYVHTFNYAWGKIDLLPGLIWRSVLLAASEEVIESATRNAFGVVVASRPHQILAACVYPLLAHGSYKDTYRSLLLELTQEETDILDVLLGRTFGQGVCAPEALLAPLHVRRMREIATRRSLSHVNGWARMVSFGFREAAVRGRESVRR